MQWAINFVQQAIGKKQKTENNKPLHVTQKNNQ